MFNDIREQRKNTFTYILVGLAGVGMLFLGVPFFSQSSTSQQSVLQVNEAEVPLDALKTQIARIQSQLPNADPQFIEQQALSVLINQSLLDQHALNSDYKLSKPALFNLVKSQYGNDEAYQAALTQMRTTASAYEAAIARKQTIQNYYQFLSTSRLDQKAVFEQFLRAAAQTRDYTLIRLPLDEAMQSIDVSEQDIEAFYQSHPEAYQTPELVSLEYVILDASNMINEDEITATDIATAKDNALRENTKRSGRYIIFANDNQGTEAAQSLADNQQTFAEIYSAVESGNIDGEAGELQLGTYGSGPSEEVDDALFALQSSGDVSELLSTEYGKMLVSLNEIQSDNIPSEEEIIADLRAKAGEEEYYDRAARAFDAALTNKPFTQIVDITGGNVQQLTQINAETTEPAWVQNTVIHQQLFGDNAVAIDKMGEPVELDNQRSVFYRVVDRDEPKVKPLTAVKTQVAQDVRREKADALLAEQSEAIAQALRNDEDIEPLIEQYHANRESLNAIGLFEARNDVDQSLIDILFNQETRVNVSTTDDGQWLVAYLENVHDGDIADMPENLQETLFAQWQANAQLELENSYSQWLREKADISVFEDNLPSSTL